MSNKSRKKKQKKTQSVRSKPIQAKSILTRRTLIRSAIAGVCLVPTYFAFSAYVDKQNLLYDLSAIGQGKPVLVQIHDPNCSKCRQLLSSVESVIDEFPEVDFRIASIKSMKGSRFAMKHNVPHVTLVMLDAEGRQVDTITGLQEGDSVRRFIEKTLK